MIQRVCFLLAAVLLLSIYCCPDRKVSIAILAVAWAFLVTAAYVLGVP